MTISLIQAITENKFPTQVHNKVDLSGGWAILPNPGPRAPPTCMRVSAPDTNYSSAYNACSNKILKRAAYSARSIRAPFTSVNKDDQPIRSVDSLFKSISLFANSRIRKSIYHADGFQFSTIQHQRSCSSL